MYISVAVVVLGAYAYYECDLYKHYEVYGATLLGVTAVLNKRGYQEQGGKLHKLVTMYHYFILAKLLLGTTTTI